MVCIRIFGFEDAKAKEYAVDMGLAMQLTNILRDVKEDAERDRIYIPQDEMSRFGYTEAELKECAVTDAFRSLMDYQSARARRYFRGQQAAVSAHFVRCADLPEVDACDIQRHIGAHRAGRLRCVRAAYRLERGREAAAAGAAVGGKSAACCFG